MALFPETSYTLLMKLAAAVTGESELAWSRFFEMYTPAIRRFVELNDHVHDPDDVVQEVYLQLVKVFRNKAYDADKAKFRTFLSTLIRRQMILMYRKDMVRPQGHATVAIEDASEELAVSPEQGRELDGRWSRAISETAVSHVLNKTALSDQSRSVYRALADEGASIEDVAKRFGIARNNVSQIKFRIDRRIEAVIRELACNEI